MICRPKIINQLAWIILTVFLINYSILAQTRNVLKKISATDNYCINMVGGTDGALSNIDLSGFQLNTLPVTIELWIKPTGTQAAYAGLLYHRGTTNAGIQFAAGWQGANKIRLDYQNPASTNGLLSPAITTDIWNHIAVVITSTNRTLYVNDVPYSESLALTNYDFSTGNLYIGWDKAVANRVYKGMIDEIRVWNVARTAQDLLNNKYKKLTGSETGLVGYWNFDDQAATATDLSVTAKHGIITGGAYVVSSVFDSMTINSVRMWQKSSEINRSSLNNVVGQITIKTSQTRNPLKLTKLYFNAQGTTTLSDITNIKVYSTGKDSVYNSATLIASLGNTPTNSEIVLNSNHTLAEGLNYFWITYDVANNATKGNLLDIECDSLIVSGTINQKLIPENKAPIGSLLINPDIFMANTKLPIDVVTNSGQTPTGGANFVSFQQNAITTYNGFQYITYWNNAYRVCLARKKIPLGNWEIIEFADYTVTAARIADNHYSISMGICPKDGTIHLAFDHHGDNLHYRKSVTGLANKPGEITWSAASFGSVQDYLIAGQQMVQVTYPRFIIKPDSSLLYEYRYGTSGGGNSLLYEYFPESGTWSKIGTYIDGLTTTNNNAYLNGIHYDANGRLHASWVWRETPDPLTNHDVCYVFSNDNGRTWFNYQNVQMGTVDSNPIKSTTSGIIVWLLNQNRGLINQESQVVDSKGGIHILQSYLFESEPNSTNFWNGRAKAQLRHIYKTEAGIWTSDTIGAVSANRSQIAIDEGDNLYVVAPNYRIYFASASEKWKKWTIFDISESASAINEGLIDREALLNESVLSLAFAQTGGKIIVPSYLVDKSKPGKGKGLHVSIHNTPNFNGNFYQFLDSINIDNNKIIYSTDSIGLKCTGVLETHYAEAYNLYFTTSGDAKVWINEELVLNTGLVLTKTIFPIPLSMQPSHKYKITIEGKYHTPNTYAQLEWESERQTRQIVPKSSLYGNLASIPNNTTPISTTELNIQCRPNPFAESTQILMDGKFMYTLFDSHGTLIEKGQAANSLIIGQHLRKGVYILQIVQNLKIMSLKLVKY